MISREVKILSIGFLLIFLGYTGTQQYVTTFFSNLGLIDTGFHSLIIIYLFFMLSDPFSAIFVSRYGSKKCILFASVFYSLFIFSLLSRSSLLIYMTSALLGFAASLLWTGQNTYLIRASNKKYYGANAGLFYTITALGASVGILFFGFTIMKFSFDFSFILFSSFPLVGFLVISTLSDIRVKVKNPLMLVRKSITSVTATRLSLVWFSSSFVAGLVMGIIPIEIKNIIGIEYIGILSLFHIVPMLFSYYMGRMSDIKGRKVMIILSYAVCVAGLISLYLSSEAALLILGIVLLTLNYSIIKPMLFALVGDVSSKNNMEPITAFLWMVQNIGVVPASVISIAFKTKFVYIISIAIILISLLILIPLLNMKIGEIRRRISIEVR